jgi:hypothetical protein
MGSNMEIFEAKVLGENPCKNPSKIMIITNHMQTIIQIYPCLLKLSRIQENVTGERPLLLYPSPLSRGGGGGGHINI